MSSVGIAASIIGMQQADTASAIAAKIIKMNAQQDQSVVALLDQALQSGQSLIDAAKAPGTGSLVDIRA